MKGFESLFFETRLSELNELGILQYNDGKYSTAQRTFEQACELAEKADDFDWLVRLRRHIAAAHHRLGNHSEALATLSWLIGVATDPASSGRTKSDDVLQILAASFADFSDAARQLSIANKDDLLRVLREGETWMVRIGKPDWTADIRLQRGLILWENRSFQEARGEMEAALAMKRRQSPQFGFTLDSHLFQLAGLLAEDSFKEYEAALNLAAEVLEHPNVTYFSALTALEILSNCHVRMGALGTAAERTRERIELSRQGEDDRERIRALLALARILQSDRCNSEALVPLREAVSLTSEDSTDLGSCANSLAWALYLVGVELDEAAELGGRAWREDKTNTNVLQTFAAILMRQNKWDEGAELVREWVRRVDREYLSSHWADDLLLFQDVLKHGHAAKLAAMLDRDIWEPMRWALRKAAENDDSLSDVPSPLRDGVATLLTQLRGKSSIVSYPNLGIP